MSSLRPEVEQYVLTHRPSLDVSTMPLAALYEIVNQIENPFGADKASDLKELLVRIDQEFGSVWPSARLLVSHVNMALKLYFVSGRVPQLPLKSVIQRSQPRDLRTESPILGSQYPSPLASLSALSDAKLKLAKTVLAARGEPLGVKTETRLEAGSLKPQQTLPVNYQMLVKQLLRQLYDEINAKYEGVEGDFRQHDTRQNIRYELVAKLFKFVS